MALAIADDLDNAVWEWGTFVENEMDRKEYDYRREVADHNASREPDSFGRMSDPWEVSPALVREAREAVFFYWVHGKRREYLAAAKAVDGNLQSAGILVLEKPAAYDGAKDWDMRDALPTTVPNPDAKWRP